jgi:hypothetical protein
LALAARLKSSLLAFLKDFGRVGLALAARLKSCPSCFPEGFWSRRLGARGATEVVA